ncbi:MAG: hypothetical protein FWE82_09855, partial [Defluviitaleaceae bacterium]|nr:hypothetical protein [Defluviitaleaceae bacterium]
MTHQQRFLATMRFQPVDRPVLRPVPVGFWYATLKRWKNEGLHIKSQNYWEMIQETNIYSGFDPNDDMNINFGFCPLFKREMICEDDEFVTFINHEGITMREYKHKGEESMPQFLEFPVKTKEDFIELLPRLQLNDSKRFPSDWPLKCEKWVEREIPVSLNTGRDGGFFGPLRNLMGLENLSYAYYDDPVLVQMMTE